MIKSMLAHVFVAGTFDGLHRGHKAVLRKAFKEGERVTIGLTSDLFVKKFKIHNSVFMIHPFEIRKQRLLHWVQEKGYSTKATIIPIDDPYEPAALMGDLNGLVLTRENRSRGEEINALREKRGISRLTLIEVPLVPAEDRKSISSTRVRRGEIDRAGRLVMPENLRPELQQPLGRLITTAQDIERALDVARKAICVVTVGDMATKTLFAADFVPDVAIVDGKIMRTPVADFVDMLAHFSRVEAVTSGPGYIAGTAAQAIRKSIAGGKGESYAINVNGEEDLLLLPVVAYAPLGTVVYYGQPPIVGSWTSQPVAEGLVEVVVTEAKKREVEGLLEKFTH